jgi:hypothetical protein
MDINLSEFDPSAAERHRVWLIIGCRGSGKSVLLMDLLYKTRDHYDCGVAMTATHTTAEVLRKAFPPSLVYPNGYNFEVVDALLEATKGLAAREKERNCLLLLDDCAFDEKVMKAPAMKEIHLNGRHSRITLMSTTQYCLTVGPLIRTNVDYVLALADNNVANRKRLFQFFFGCFPNFAQFDAVFREVTKDYGCMVLNNTNKTGTVSESVSWYKADEAPGRFRLMKNKMYDLDATTREKVTEHQKEGKFAETKVVSAPKQS